MGVGRKFFDVVVVKASFDLVTGIAQLSQNQTVVCLADELWQDEDDNIKEHQNMPALKPLATPFI